jgi:NAD(P)-dependent dehydrogenase (short-subunit alcohol dehydrogenase family)
MARDFEGQVVWITGASAGLGREMAREFARRGADLALSARRVDRIESLAEELRKEGGRALAVPCDVTREETVRDAVATVTEELGRLDVAVANAGFGVNGRFEDLSVDDWRRQLETNVMGVVLTAHYALPRLRETRGRLALVASVSAMVATPASVAYTTSKYAVRALGQTLSLELAGTGVTCTTLHPGFVESEIGQVDNRGNFRANRKDNRPAALMWPTAKAARVMVDAIQRRKREYVFTAHGRAGAWLGRHAPGFVHFVLTRFGGSAG